MRIIVATLLALASFAAPAPAQEAGKATGTLALDEQVTGLTHAYARELRDIPEMQLEGRPETQIVVILVDRALPPDAAGNDMAVSQLGLTGGARGVVLTFDPRSGQILSGRSVVSQAEAPQFFSNVGDPAVAMALSENFKLDGDRVAARAFSPRPNEVLSMDGSGPSSWRFDATFEAPVAPAPPLTATLEGEAARSSGPGQAVARFIEAVATADMDGVLAGTVAEHPARTMLTPEGMAQMKDMLLASGADPAAFLAGLGKVYVYGDHAVVLITEGNGWTTMPVLREGDAWKLGMP